MQYMRRSLETCVDSDVSSHVAFVFHEILIHTYPSWPTPSEVGPLNEGVYTQEENMEDFWWLLTYKADC